MQVFRSLDAYPHTDATVLTMGTFDGVHPGHQAILHRVVQSARKFNAASCVVTFHPHPRAVLNPQDDSLRLLHTLAEKTAHLAQLGIDRLLVLPFTPELAQTESAVFIRQILVQGLHARHIVIGYDHRFGRGRGGGLSELQSLGPALGFTVEEIPAQEIDDAKVSSTRIRTALLAGEVGEAARLLGYPYPLSATVVHGDKRGRQLGYPTANLRIQTDEPKLLPANGVYAVWVTHAGHTYRGMMNLGNRPTVDGLRWVPEVHLLDYSGDLYGQTLHLHFVERIRTEKRFDGLDALKQQLAQDEADTRRILSP